MTDLWPRLEPLLAAAERPARYLNHEFGCVYKPEADFRFCMVYPDTYELGQANQALRILVNVVNAVDGMAAERAFLPAPAMCDTLRAEGIPLFSIESCAPLAEFDAVGITLPHELAATNVLETLDLAGIPLHADERAESDPLVVGGGPCAYNPEPYAPFFDAFSIGEGEEALPRGLAVVRRLRAEGAARADILRALADEPGWYVPSLYRWRAEDEAQEAGSWIEPLEEGLPLRIEKSLFEGFAESPGWEPCIVPFTEVVHDRLNVEILRGCARGCRFCQAGMMYRPVRERSADNVVESVVQGLAETGYDEDSLTFAPEAGTQRLRDVINKNVTEDDLFGALDAAFKAGWRRCKLYFMIGLPTETDDDIKGIASLAQRAYDRMKAATPPEQRGSLRMSVSCALFVPKAQTPFQWDGQIPPEEALRRVQLLRNSVKYRAVDVHWHDPATSFVEAVMSRAGREAAAWVEAAWRRGARFDAWTECFAEAAWREAADEVGIDPAAIAQTAYPTTRVMPWEHISTGVSTRWLARERRLADEGRTTPDCTFENCSACGACPTLGVDNELAQPRVASGSNAVEPSCRPGRSAESELLRHPGQSGEADASSVILGERSETKDPARREGAGKEATHA